jgi:hypothetical protein
MDRVLIVLEMVLLLGGGLLLAGVLLIGPLGSSEDFTTLSKAGHLAAFISLAPLSLLSLGYVRYPDEFAFALDGPWILAIGSVAVPAFVAITSVLGLNGDRIRIVDVAVCLVAIPLVHLLIAGLNRRHG